MENQSREQAIRSGVVRFGAVALALFTLAEVNYPNLQTKSQLAIFALLGLVLCFLTQPVAKRFKDHPLARLLDWLMATLAVVVCGYVVVQSEPAFERFWSNGVSLGNRAGAEVATDYAMGALGLVVVVEATRRVVGWALPVLALAFLAYAHWGQAMPDWLFPHRGYSWTRIAGQTFLHGQGVFGIALSVMLKYVYLFVVFGALLEMTGATRFILEAARRLFGSSAGAPAKVSILSSGLMGSLSGSAVANTATTGTFTIPLMKSAGFRSHEAGGIEAAASSGGALVPPVMGAGAYMMLEIVTPPVTYLEIIRAAVLPALLYYFSLFMIVHLTARRMSPSPDDTVQPDDPTVDSTIEVPGPAPSGKLPGLVFFTGLSVLVGFLLAGYTVFRAVTMAMIAVVILSQFSADARLGPRRLIAACERAARGGVSLVAAAASVGIVLGVVTLTGVGSKLPATIIPLAENNLFLALVLIMLSSIVLGMGLPSAVCYLLLATLIGPALGSLGVVPLAAHFFIFYFGLMSMVTPPVALAAYTAASIAESGIMRTTFAAFRASLIGFVLPYLFVFRPELLMLAPGGEKASLGAIALAFGMTALGTLPLAASLAGFLFQPLTWLSKGALFVAAALIFLPAEGLSAWNAIGLFLFVLTAAILWWRRESRPGA